MKFPFLQMNICLYGTGAVVILVISLYDFRTILKILICIFLFILGLVSINYSYCLLFQLYIAFIHKKLSNYKLYFTRFYYY